MQLQDWMTEVGKNPASPVVTPLCKALLEKKEYQHVIEIAEKCLPSQGSSQALRYILAVAYLRVGDSNSAQIHLVVVVSKDTSKPGPLLLLAEVLLKKKEIEKARRLLNRAQKIATTDAMKTRLKRLAMAAKKLSEATPQPHGERQERKTGGEPNPDQADAQSGVGATGPSQDRLTKLASSLLVPTKQVVLPEAGTPEATAPSLPSTKTIPPAVPAAHQKKQSTAQKPPAIPVASIPPDPIAKLTTLGSDQQTTARMPEDQGQETTDTAVPSQRVISKENSSREPGAQGLADRREELWQGLREPQTAEDKQELSSRSVDDGDSASASAETSPKTPPMDSPGASQHASASKDLRIRPRLPSHIMGKKQKNAAVMPLEQSAAAGDHHLRSLISRGVLAIPGVVVSSTQQQSSSSAVLTKVFSPVKSLKKYMQFVLIVCALSGITAGALLLIGSKKTASAVAASHKDADQSLVSTQYSALRTARGRLEQSLRVQDNLRSNILLAKVSAVSSLLYGVPSTAESVSLQAAMGEVSSNDDLYSDALLTQVVNQLNQLPTMSQPFGALRILAEKVDARLAAKEDATTPWLWWARARLHVGLGERAAAVTALDTSIAGGDLVLAKVDRAAMFAQEAQYGVAEERFRSILKIHPEHTLAAVALSLVLVDSGQEPADVFAGLKALPDDTLGTVGLHRRDLLFAQLNTELEYYSDAKEQWSRLPIFSDPDWEARRAFVGFRLGLVPEARKAMQSLGARSKGQPLVGFVNATFSLYDGVPQQAVDRASDWQSPQGKLLIAQGDLLQHKVRRATKILLELRKEFPQDPLIALWYRCAEIMTVQTQSSLEKATKHLSELARKRTAKDARFVHALALFYRGNLSTSKRLAELAVAESADDVPNLWLPASYALLANIALEEYREATSEERKVERQRRGTSRKSRRPPNSNKGQGDAAIASAQKWLNLLLQHSPSYRPAVGIRARIDLAKQNSKAASQGLSKLLETPSAAMWADEVAYAQVVLGRGGKKSSAKAALERALKKGGKKSVVLAVAAQIDPNWTPSVNKQRTSL